MLWKKRRTLFVSNKGNLALHQGMFEGPEQVRKQTCMFLRLHPRMIRQRIRQQAGTISNFQILKSTFADSTSVCRLTDRNANHVKFIDLPLADKFSGYSPWSLGLARSGLIVKRGHALTEAAL